MQSLKEMRHILRNFVRNPFDLNETGERMLEIMHETQLSYNEMWNNMEIEEEEEETAVVPANVQPRREVRILQVRNEPQTPVGWRRREESEAADTPRFVADDSEGRPRRRSRINRQLVRPRPLILDLVPPSPAEADGSITVSTPDRRPTVVVPVAPSVPRVWRRMERLNVQPIPFSLDSSPEQLPVPEYSEEDLKTPQDVENRSSVVQTPVYETPVARRHEEREAAGTARFVAGVEDSEGRPRRRSRINRQFVRPLPLVLDLVPPSPTEADGAITVSTPVRRPPVVVPVAPSRPRMTRLMNRSNWQPIRFSIDSTPERKPVLEYSEEDLRTPPNVANGSSVAQESSPLLLLTPTTRRRFLFPMSSSIPVVNNEVSDDLLRTPEFVSNGNMQTQVMTSTRHPTPASSRRRRREIKRHNEDTGVVPSLDEGNE